MPSEDWEMTLFLHKLADELTEDDLKRMKDLLKGMYPTGDRVLEEIKDCLDFFKHLRHRLILTRDNIMMLQALIWHTNRKDLHQLIVEFSRQMGDVVHFYQPDDEPLNGSMYVQFHVAGKERMNRHKLEELRSLVGRLVGVPPQYVLTAGIEATNSVFVTFMIPEGYSNILLDMKQTEKEYLGSKGVDTIVIDGQTIICTDLPCTEEGIIKDEEIKLLLDQKSKYEKEIEDQQILLLEKDRLINQYDSTIKELKAKARWNKFEVDSHFIEAYIGENHTPKDLSLRAIAAENAENALQDYLHKAEKLGYDRKFLMYLLEANTLCITSQQNSFNGAIQANLNSRIKTLQTQVVKLAYERDKLAYFLHGDVSKLVLTENEEFFLNVMALPFPLSFGRHTVTIQTEKSKIDPEAGKKVCQELLTKMESFFGEDQLEMLRQKFLCSKQDLQRYHDSKLSLLNYLWKCEIEKKGHIGVDLREWMTKILAFIDRMDLFDKLIQLSTEIYVKATSQFKETEGNLQEIQATNSKEEEMYSQTPQYSSERENGVPGKQRESAKPENADSGVTGARLERIEETLKILENLSMQILSKENTKKTHPDESEYDNWRELSPIFGLCSSLKANNRFLSLD